MKPIQNAFKLVGAALCLANEWRDTLGLAALVVKADVMLAQGNGEWIPLVVCGVASIRELGRSAFWDICPPKLKAGYNQAPIDHANKAAAAGLVSSVFALGTLGFCLGHIEAPQDTIVYSVVGACVSGIGLRHYRRLSYGQAKLKDIPAFYFDKETGMWDWPRKQGGGGTTQTRKLLDGISTMGAKLVSPSPAMQPALASVRDKRSRYNILAS